MKAPVGLLSDRTVLRSKMEGFYPDKFRTGKAVRFDAEDGFGVNPADGTVPEGIAAQAEQSCKNVDAILETAGTDFTKVLKTTCFLADMGDFAAFNEIYANYFTSKPARSCVAVKALPKNVLCEIEAIAVK